MYQLESGRDCLVCAHMLRSNADAPRENSDCTKLFTACKRLFVIFSHHERDKSVRDSVKREKETEREKESECVSVCKRERERVRERESVCVCDIESVCVREREGVCVCVREKERERESGTSRTDRRWADMGCATLTTEAASRRRIVT